MKVYTDYQRLIFIFFTLTSMILVGLVTLQEGSERWINQQRLHDCGAQARLSFSTPLSEHENQLIRNHFARNEISEQKTFATTAFQGEHVVMLQAKVLYDPYPLTQAPLSLKHNTLLINKAFAERLADNSPLVLGKDSFDQWDVIEPSFYWSMMDVIWPTVWLTPQQLTQTQLLATGSRYHTEFHINTMSIPRELQDFVEKAHGQFETYLDQENILNDFIQTMNGYVNWFVITLIILQSLGLWLLMTKEQEKQEPRLFYHRWYNLSWPFKHLLFNRSFIILSAMIGALIFLSGGVSFYWNIPFFKTLMRTLCGQWLLIVSIIMMMSTPFGYHKDYRILHCIFALLMGFSWSLTLNASIGSWLSCMIFIIAALMLTSSVLSLTGVILRIGDYWPLSLLGRFWQRKAFSHCWPQAVLVITLVFMVLAGHLTIALTQFLKEPLLAHRDNFFAINIPLNATLHLDAVIGLKQYQLLRPKLIGIDNEYIKQSRTDKREGRTGVYRPLNCIMSDSIPNDNKIVQGSWPVKPLDVTKQPYPLLIEEGFAKKMGITIGSLLEFDTALGSITGKAVAFQKANWQSMKPNFFVIFPQGTVNRYLESTMIAGFAPSIQKKEIFLSLAQEYPSTTFFDVDEVKKIAQRNIEPIIQGSFLLLSGFLLIATLFSAFVKDIYPLKLLPAALSFALLGKKSNLLEQQSRQSEYILLTLFILALCKGIFTYVHWSWISLAELNYSWLSLIISTLSSYLLLSFTKKSSLH